MIEGLAITDNFITRKNQKIKFKYTLKPNGTSKGPLRSIQKFVVILLTTEGTDPLHPWFGTNINYLTHMNISSKAKVEAFIQDETSKAISQFFKLQAEESTQNSQTGYDVIMTVELTKVVINNNNSISMTFLFKPLKSDAIIFSIDYEI